MSKHNKGKKRNRWRGKRTRFKLDHHLTNRTLNIPGIRSDRDPVLVRSRAYQQKRAARAEKRRLEREASDVDGA